MKTWIGIDNGVTGSIGIINDNDVEFYKTPSRTEQSYTKKKQNITRVDISELKHILSNYDPDETKVLLERPYVNPTGIKATISAVRCLEAVLITIENLCIPYEYIDSRQWQKEMLPKGCKGTKELKKASLDVGMRLFPGWKKEILKQKDADGLLIAEWARRRGL